MQTWSSLTSCSVSPAAPTCVKVINKLIKELIINQLTMVINKLAEVIINIEWCFFKNHLQLVLFKAALVRVRGNVVVWAELQNMI